MTNSKKTTYWIAGIDPGAKGAIALIDKDDLHNFKIFDFIDARCFCQVFYDNHKFIKMANVEKVHAMPGQGVKSMFSMGWNLGFIEGLLDAFKISYIHTQPKAWQKGLIPPKSDKKKHVEVAQRLFPKAELKGVRGGLKDGRADALLIAYYLWCKHDKKVY